MLSARFEPKTTTNIAIFADNGKVLKKGHLMPLWDPRSEPGMTEEMAGRGMTDGRNIL